MTASEIRQALGESIKELLKSTNGKQSPELITLSPKHYYTLINETHCDVIMNWETNRWQFKGVELRHSLEIGPDTFIIA